LEEVYKAEDNNDPKVSRIQVSTRLRKSLNVRAIGKWKMSMNVRNK
jgi:hypothetical protein